jgi:hypothetical protein
MPDAKYIARTENISGELFDLSVPSLNNDFGWKHITGVMRYGISFPLEKFIDELEAILKEGGPPDDKSAKREARLRFLYHCFESREVQDLFPLFCNYINGGGEYKHGTWEDDQYDQNYFVITVAGGNIIHNLMLLIMNMKIGTFMIVRILLRHLMMVKLLILEILCLIIVLEHGKK